MINSSPNTIVYAALKEQQLLNLPCYRNIEPLLKFDEMYHLDHVTAYKMTNSKMSLSVPKPDRATNVNKSYPLPSKKFRVTNVKVHFTKCWKLEKSKSSKLSFYNTIKNKFAQESYLDTVKGFSRRYNTSKLRISAHNLEIEQGRYTNTPRHVNSKSALKWLKIKIFFYTTVTSIMTYGSN